jgi:hypothetical protein
MINTVGHFCNFCQYSAKKWRFYLNYVIFHKLVTNNVLNPQQPFLGETNFEINTLVPARIRLTAPKRRWHHLTTPPEHRNLKTRRTTRMPWWESNMDHLFLPTVPQWNPVSLTDSISRPICTDLESKTLHLVALIQLFQSPGDFQVSMVTLFAVARNRLYETFFRTISFRTFLFPFIPLFLLIDKISSKHCRPIFKWQRIKFFD